MQIGSRLITLNFKEGMIVWLWEGKGKKRKLEKEGGRQRRKEEGRIYLARILTLFHIPKTLLNEMKCNNNQHNNNHCEILLAYTIKPFHHTI